MSYSPKKVLHRVYRATSFILVLKGAVAGSVAMLALFGVSVPALDPLLGIQATNVSGGVAASIGAVVGAIAAIKA